MRSSLLDGAVLLEAKGSTAHGISEKEKAGTGSQDVQAIED